MNETKLPPSTIPGLDPPLEVATAEIRIGIFPERQPKGLLACILLSAAVTTTLTVFPKASPSTAFSALAVGSSESFGHPAPAWLEAHMANQIGVWHSVAYQQDGEEQSAQWGQEWRWGIGQQTIHGSLFSVIPGVSGAEAARGDSIWEFWLIWNPATGAAEARQVNGEGWYGVGELRLLEADGEHRTFELEQDFTLPDGRSFRTRHVVHESKELLRMEVFNEKDGEWQPDHEISWRRVQAE